MKRVIIFVLTAVLLISTLGSCAKNVDTERNDLQTSDLGRGLLSPVHEYNGWVYYTDYQKGIYKVRTNGKDKTLVIEKTPYWFEIYEDRIYYAMFKDGDDFDNSIYSCKTDGSDVTFICEKRFDINGVLRLDIVNHWIYFIDQQVLYRIKTDGTNKMQYNEREEPINDFAIEDGWIYFTTIYFVKEEKLEHFFHLNRMRNDGMRKTQLTTEGCRNIELKDDWVYFIDKQETGIFRTRLDSNVKQKLTDCAGGSYKRLFKVIGDWVYYEDNVEGEGIYKVKTDGSEKFKVSGDIQDYSYFFNVWENWFVYIDPPKIYPEEEPGVAHLIRLSNMCETDAVIEQILEEIDEDIKIIKYEEFSHVSLTQEDDNEAAVLSENDNWYSGFRLMTNNFVEHDGWIYYSEFGKFGNGDLYRIRPDGTQKEKIYECKAYMFEIYKNRLYVLSNDIGMISFNLDGSNKKFYNIGSYTLFAKNDSLYLLRGKSIYAIKLGTNEHKMLSANNEICKDLSISGEWIYYVRLIYDESWDLYLYRMKTDGTEKTKLTQNGCMAIDYYDEWIYYADESGKSIFKMKMDGSENQELTSCNISSTSFFKVFGDWVYYENVGEGFGLYKVNTQTGQSIKVLETRMDAYVGMGGNWLINIKRDYGTPFKTTYQLIRVGDTETTDDIIKMILDEMPEDVEILIVE